jgi:starch phosphorylase
MWQRLWPDRPLHDVPIGHVTNGVHAPTWMATRMQALMARVAGSDWIDRQIDPATWAAIDRVGDEELWATHQQCKRDLIAFARERSVVAARRRGEPQHVISALEGALSEDTMLVGFARRFATYKRATLALSDWDAIDRIVNHAECPVTFVFAGKAHPRDDGGKRMLQQVFEASRDPRFLGKVVVLEGYDMEVGRRLTQGVDVWLNNPRRPLEASGTSGQKVVLNGGLNCSVLDGWWAEAWDGQNGFAIGRGFAHRRVGVQDQRDFEDLMDVLPREVVPLYYRRGDGDAGPLPYE